MPGHFVKTNKPLNQNGVNVQDEDLPLVPLLHHFLFFGFLFVFKQITWMKQKEYLSHFLIAQ